MRCLRAPLPLTTIDFLQRTSIGLDMCNSFNAEGLQIELYHASPASLGKITWPWAPLEEIDALHKQEETKLVLFGHVHNAFTRYDSQGRLVVNCGSIGLPFDGDNRACYSVVDIDKHNLSVQHRRISYDIEKSITIAMQRRMPDTDLFAQGVREARYPYPSRPSINNVAQA